MTTLLILYLANILLIQRYVVYVYGRYAAYEVGTDSEF